MAESVWSKLSESCIKTVLTAASNGAALAAAGSSIGQGHLGIILGTATGIVSGSVDEISRRTKEALFGKETDRQQSKKTILGSAAIGTMGNLVKGLGTGVVVSKVAPKVFQTVAENLPEITPKVGVIGGAMYGIGASVLYASESYGRWQAMKAAQSRADDIEAQNPPNYTSSYTR